MPLPLFYSTVREVALYLVNHYPQADLTLEDKMIRRLCPVLRAFLHDAFDRYSHRHFSIRRPHRYSIAKKQFLESLTELGLVDRHERVDGHFILKANSNFKAAILYAIGALEMPRVPERDEEE